MTIEEIQDKIIEQVQLEHYDVARNLITAVAERSNADKDVVQKYQKLYEEQKAANEKLEKKMEQLQEPPLSQGIILGPSPDAEKNVVVGIGGQRFEVRLADKSSFQPADLVAGQEAWLNQDRQIVKVREAANVGEAGEVLAVLDDTHLEVKTHGTDGMVVECAPQLQEERLKIGDRVRVDPHLAIAFQKLESTETKELELEEVPDVTYDDIGGLDEEIEQIQDAIELPYLYNQLFRLYHLKRPKGILLYGPPGCGKTMLAKAIANHLTTEITKNLKQIEKTLELLVFVQEEDVTFAGAIKVYKKWLTVVKGETEEEEQSKLPETIEQIRTELSEFLTIRDVPHEHPEEELKVIKRQLSEGSQAYFMSIKGPELLNKYVGETEHSIRRLFLQAKRRASTTTPVIMFFDEIEALFRRRGSRLSSDVESTIVPQFLSEIDGVEGLNNVIIIGATNRQDLMDPAILRPGRLDIKIKVNRPNKKAAIAIFSKYLSLELPVELNEEGEDGKEAAIQEMIKKGAGMMYDDGSVFKVTGKSTGGKPQSHPCREFLSGAMIENIVNHCKKRALKRELQNGRRGICWEDLRDAIKEELEQNKDQLVSTTLNLSEEDLTVECVLAETFIGEGIPPLLQLIERPWQNVMLSELSIS